jgi:hypothetical protein
LFAKMTHRFPAPRRLPATAEPRLTASASVV